MPGGFVLLKEHVSRHFKGLLPPHIYIHKDEFVCVGQSAVIPDDLRVYSGLDLNLALGQFLHVSVFKFTPSVLRSSIT